MKRRSARGAGAILLALLAAIGAGCGGRSTHATAPAATMSAPTTGCRLRASAYGYPDWYVTQRLPYAKHPPLPRAGWYGRENAVPFPVLFHSLFHGYIVVRYGRDLSPRTKAMLRTWVVAHAGVRVTATPSPNPERVGLDAAEWGHELVCARSDALRPEMLRRLLLLR